MTVPEIIEQVVAEMCDKYCRFPYEPIPEGKDEGWLINDPDTPCKDCPLNRLT